MFQNTLESAKANAVANARQTCETWTIYRDTSGNLRIGKLKQSPRNSIIAFAFPDEKLIFTAKGGDMRFLTDQRTKNATPAGRARFIRDMAMKHWSPPVKQKDATNQDNVTTAAMIAALFVAPDLFDDGEVSLTPNQVQVLKDGIELMEREFLERFASDAS